MKALRIAIAGLGTVGAGVVQLVQQNKNLISTRAGQPVQIVAVSARDKKKPRTCNLDGMLWFDDPRQLAVMPEADVVVEVIGGADGIAKEICEAALSNGKHVVTANKAMMATHGVGLAQLAEAQNKQLMFEAAVAGGVPIIKALREGLAGNEIEEVQGILNGTCNYILTRMQEAKLDFESALKEAQGLGYAEANPAADIDGHDTAHKLTLLTALAFGVKPDLSAIKMDGIRHITSADLQFAADLNYRIKLLGVSRMAAFGLEQRVGPCLVPMTSPLSNVQGVLNAVQVLGNAVGSVMLSGAGAGAGPTATAIVADLVDIARGSNMRVFSMPVIQLRSQMSVIPDKCISGWYVRVQVKDQPGIISEISTILRDEAISIESLLQYGCSDTDSVPVVLITHEVSETVIKRAMARIVKLSAVKEKPCCLRIEKH